MVSRWLILVDTNLAKSLVELAKKDLNSMQACNVLPYSSDRIIGQQCKSRKNSSYFNFQATGNYIIYIHVCNQFQTFTNFKISHLAKQDSSLAPKRPTMQTDIIHSMKLCIGSICSDTQVRIKVCIIVKCGYLQRKFINGGKIVGVRVGG